MTNKKNIFGIGDTIKTSTENYIVIGVELIENKTAVRYTVVAAGRYADKTPKHLIHHLAERKPASKPSAYTVTTASGHSANVKTSRTDRYSVSGLVSVEHSLYVNSLNTCFDTFSAALNYYNSIVGQTGYYEITLGVKRGKHYDRIETYNKHNMEKIDLMVNAAKTVNAATGNVCGTMESDDMMVCASNGGDYFAQEVFCGPDGFNNHLSETIHDAYVTAYRNAMDESTLFPKEDYDYHASCFDASGIYENVKDKFCEWAESYSWTNAEAFWNRYSYYLMDMDEYVRDLEGIDDEYEYGRYLLWVPWKQEQSIKKYNVNF